jgi:hypothetical protein
MYEEITTLSHAMKLALKNSLLSPNFKINKSTLKSLLKRNLISNDYKLTHFGYYTAISLLSLKEQCNILKFQINELKINQKIYHPELMAINYYKDMNKEIYFIENSIAYHFFKILIFDELNSYMNKTKNFWSKYVYLQAYDDFIKIIDTEMINRIKLIKEDKFKKNINLILEPLEKQKYIIDDDNIKIEILIKNNMFYNDPFDGLNFNIFVKLFKYLKQNTFEKMVGIFFQDPYLFRRGWPDLILFDNHDVKFIEIKTTDKLTYHQIVTLDHMVNKAGIDFSILKLTP